MTVCGRVCDSHPSLPPPVGNTDYCNAGCINSWLGDRYCDMVHLLYQPSPNHPSSSITLSPPLSHLLPVSPLSPSLPPLSPPLSPSPSPSSHSHVGSQAVVMMLVIVALTIGKNFLASRSDFKLSPLTFAVIILLFTSPGGSNWWQLHCPSGDHSHVLQFD